MKPAAMTDPAEATVLLAGTRTVKSRTVFLTALELGEGAGFPVFFLGYAIKMHGYCLQLVHDHFLLEIIIYVMF
jgi:hypothetical protein